MIRKLSRHILENRRRDRWHYWKYRTYRFIME
jgi:hypothetical protein